MGGWSLASAALLLAGLCAAPRHARAEPHPAERDPELRDLSTAFAATIGARQLDVRALDRALQRDGFAALPSTWLVFGVDIELLFGRTRVGMSFSGTRDSAQHRAAPGAVETSLLEVGVHAGYEIIREGSFTFFAAGGLAVTSLRLDVGDPELRSFRQLLDEDALRAGSISWGAATLPMELGTDYLVSMGRLDHEGDWGLLIGTRFSWIHDIGSDGWWTGEDDPRPIRGAPDLDAGGARIRLVLGFAAYAF